MNKYKKIELAQKIVALPFKIVLFPITLLICFLITDWNDEWDRQYFREKLKIW